MADSKPTEELDTVVIRFAGDSGDGMQLTGNRFTNEAAHFGNDLRTFPDFPAEIRAPAGTLAGVSAFQVSFSHLDIHTPGDAVDVLVAMNPAALKMNLKDLRESGILIANTAQFTKKNLQKAGYESDPLESDIVDKYRVHPIDISKMTEAALDDMGLPPRTVERCKNFFALGIAFWMYDRTIDKTADWLDKKFAKKPELAEANKRVLKAGYYFGETSEVFKTQYKVRAADIEPGTYRNVSGNKALALGFVVASRKSKCDLFLGSYPITPASDILHELSAFKNYGVHTFQAEDEIAGVAAAIGASFGGALALTTTSGPGIALKAEAIGLAIMTELPLIVVNVQRGGPSTGLPTKTEQADLLQALYGRNGEAPMPVISASTPSDCFEVAYEACRVAMKYMTPVMLLSDGYLANGSEPWKLPDLDALNEFDVQWRTEVEGFQPYLRDPETLARPHVRLGTPGLEHRIGGLEKEHLTGNVSYDPDNHELMCRMRAEKVERVAAEIPATEIVGDSTGDVLILGWGSTYGAIFGAGNELREAGKKVSSAHLRWLNPLPPDLEEVMKGFKHILVPELNMGQLSFVLRGKYLVDAKSLNKVQGQPFKKSEIVDACNTLLDGKELSPYLTDGLEQVVRGLKDSAMAQAS
jgi:2-oxoglutarate ferredoxin oxidoreductase subunit alpha